MDTRDNSTRHNRTRLLTSVLLSILVALCVGAGGFAEAGSAAPRATVRTWTIHYTAHNGTDRLAYVVLPTWYGPKKNPSIPVVISPHGRNATGLSNTKYFGNLPAVGRFAVISPDGMGRRLALKSYAYRGQIDDLAKMPDFAERALPWLHLDRSRVYAVGSSMGGHETLMLIARNPDLLAGAAAMDSVTNLSRRYAQLPNTACDKVCQKRWGQPYGLVLQAAMREEVGGTPAETPKAYDARSPLAFARTIAYSGVPLQIWWSTTDKIVTDQQHQSGTLFRVLRQLNPHAPISAYTGRWPHSKEMKASQLLPITLKRLGLLPQSVKKLPKSVRYQAAPILDV
jgi:pimeloyl-ACP methyl ester carboxylesterase